MSEPDSDPDSFAITPFWDPAMVPRYRTCWLPTADNLQSESLADESHWFEHTSFTKTTNGSNDVPFKLKENIDVSLAHSKKKSKRRKKTIGSKKILSEDETYRTHKVRLYPTMEQKLLLQKWFAGSRYTYNWAMYKTKTMRECGFRVNYSRQALRNLVVPEKVIPKRNKSLNWLLEVPKDIRAQATFELSDAYLNTFDKFKKTGKTSVMKFRSVKDGLQSITIQSNGISTNQETGSLNIYSTFMKQPIKMREDILVSKGISLKISYSRTGKYYVHVLRIVNKTQTTSTDIGAIDPGVKPDLAYYSPTKGDAGFIGTENDVEKLIKIALRSDKISSLLDTTDMSHHKRWKLRRKRFKLNARIRNRVEEVLNHATKYMCQNYGVILLPTFPVSNMIRKSDRRIRKSTVRSMLSWRHASLRKKMQDKAELLGVHLRMVGEAYTSKTCGNCGYVKANLGGMVYNCNSCQIRMHRQLNGPRNIFLKHIKDYI
jgi:putative transposase